MRKAPGECAVDISLYPKGVGKSSRFVRAGCLFNIFQVVQLLAILLRIVIDVLWVKIPSPSLQNVGSE